MSKQGTVRRYILIIEKLGRKQFPSFDEIKNYLNNHDIDFSSRTIELQ